MAKITKTNVMRILDKENIVYKMHSYDNKDGRIDGIAVAEKLGQDVKKVYKTLVTQGHSKNYFVFVIPVVEELDLKAASKSVNEKAIEMIKVADINKITGYIRGGCSPIGMKKNYRTVIDESCKDLETIIVSAGKIGFQVELSPNDLLKIIEGSFDYVIV